MIVKHIPCKSIQDHLISYVHSERNSTILVTDFPVLVGGVNILFNRALYEQQTKTLQSEYIIDAYEPKLQD